MGAAPALVDRAAVVLLCLQAAAGLLILQLGAVEEGAQDQDKDHDGAGYDADHHGRHGPLVRPAAERVVVIRLVVAADALGHVCGRLGGWQCAGKGDCLWSFHCRYSAGFDLLVSVNFGKVSSLGTEGLPNCISPTSVCPETCFVVASDCGEESRCRIFQGLRLSRVCEKAWWISECAEFTRGSCAPARARSFLPLAVRNPGQPVVETKRNNNVSQEDS